jgi:two-component system sensor histidine kinase MprB
MLANGDLAMIVSEAIDLNHKQAAKGKITIQNNVESQSVMTNASALTEIISIIVNNAIKYSPERSTIIISGDQRSLSVVDQGSGIAEADLPHIFDRFYRAEKSRTSEGYGLGLSLAQHLAKRIGATITAGNNSDHGAVFTIIFSAR